MTRKRWILLLVVAGCLLMALVDFTQLHYVPKAAVKIFAFASIPAFYHVFARSPNKWDFLRYKKKSLGSALLLGFVVYVCILLAYFTLGSFFDFSNVAHVLNDTVGVNKGNFLYISIYISFINSFIEEFFFRGFAFLALKKVSSRRFAMIFSSLAFAVYHVTLMAGLFDLPLYLLCLVALAIAGLMFNGLDEKSGTLYPSWIVHASANFAINTIGFILLGML